MEEMINDVLKQVKEAGGRVVMPKLSLGDEGTLPFYRFTRKQTSLALKKLKRD
jgi:predicted enzyme related to lactoylglutathione lyase